MDFIRYIYIYTEFHLVVVLLSSTLVTSKWTTLSVLLTISMRAGYFWNQGGLRNSGP
jgi:hypothetical protein